MPCQSTTPCSIWNSTQYHASAPCLYTSTWVACLVNHRNAKGCHGHQALSTQRGSQCRAHRLSELRVSCGMWCLCGDAHLGSACSESLKPFMPAHSPECHTVMDCSVSSHLLGPVSVLAHLQPAGCGACSSFCGHAPCTAGLFASFLQAQRVGDLSQLALRKPQKGGPFIISRQPYGDILTDYEASSHAWRLCAYGCGALGVTLLGIKVIAFGLRKYREHSTR